MTECDEQTLSERTFLLYPLKMDYTPIKLPNRCFYSSLTAFMALFCAHCVFHLRYVLVIVVILFILGRKFEYTEPCMQW